MRIIIDLQGSQSISRFRGIGRYSLSLALALAKNYHQKHDIIILLNEMLPNAIYTIRETFHGILPQSNIKVWHGCEPVQYSDPDNDLRIQISALLRESFIAALKPDILFITSVIEGYNDYSVVAPFNHYSIPIAAMFYDAIPYMHADKYIAPQGKRYEAYYYEKIDIIKNANLIFSISNSSCNEAIDVLNIDKNKVSNISAAANDYFKPITYDISTPITKLQHLGIEKKFILYTGASDERKNRLRLVKAFSLLKNTYQEEYQLVIAGLVTPESKNDIAKHIKACNLTIKQVIFTNTVTDEELLDLYNLCELYVFPSYHEGFGLPALEAMQCGAATIGANTTSVPEVIERNDALFDPFSEDSIAKKIEEVLSNPTFKASLQAHGLNQAKKFSWQKSAAYVIDALEKWYANHTQTISIDQDTIKEKLIDNISLIALEENDLLYSAKAIVANHTQPKKKQFLLDISELSQRDAKTGIQRVVRSIVYEILHHTDIEEYEIKTIYFDGQIYRNTTKFHPNPENESNDEVINFYEDDIYLSLDLNSQFTSYTYHLHKSLQNIGVKLYFIVYDILLVQRPDWWPKGTSKLFESWLNNIIEVSTGLICISQTVANDVKEWIVQNPPKRLTHPEITHFHLGANIDNSIPSKGFPEDANFVLKSMQSSPSFLIVGTIEPRKGHQTILEAFEQLWDNDIDVNLIIVGKAGWLVDTLITKLQSHPKLHKNLFWLQGISDEYLEEVYKHSTVLLASSEGEGFGLPLIEAAQKELPIIARDLPVFKEVAQSHAYYFPNTDDTKIIAESITKWLQLYRHSKHPESIHMPWLTWKQSTQELLKCVIVNKDNIHA